MSKEKMEQPVKELTTRFQLKKVVMEKKRWSMLIEVSGFFEKLYLRYNMTFVPDESGFDYNIEQEKEKIYKYENDPQLDLLGGTNEAKIKICREEILQIERNRKEFLMNNYPMDAQVSIIEFKDKDTMMINFRIPDDLVSFLNAKKFNISDNYILKLTVPEVKVDSLGKIIL